MKVGEVCPEVRKDRRIGWYQVISVQPFKAILMAVTNPNDLMPEKLRRLNKERDMACKTCEGSGDYIPGMACPRCRGSGRRIPLTSPKPQQPRIRPMPSWRASPLSQFFPHL